MTGHHEEETPHGLALVNQPSRHPSLAPLASQCLHTSTSLRPATTKRSHLILLALVSKLSWLCLLGKLGQGGPATTQGS
ncbi:hypothetical protein TIFTF001_040708 [Ficus carica]|uniref:Uncharacterized protein n=1 Tax=Ficus carica TaxID=3494 RepID=A0AA88CQA4_FICCA|nr:hypothetical protein TIFTF001_040708 [Ficus carica]